MTALPDDIRALLQALYDVLAIPAPDITDADERVYQRIIGQRAAAARIALNGILHHDHDLPGTTSWLDRHVADTPVTYTAWVALSQGRPGKDSDTTFSEPPGRGAEYVVSRLKRDDPALAERVVSGHLPGCAAETYPDPGTCFCGQRRAFAAEHNLDQDEADLLMEEQAHNR
jgi:hypothetical protein